MNILITNDDGISSPGIYFLVKEFVQEGNVIVSAPDSQRSASSHSITMHGPIWAKKTDFYGLNCTAYAVSGTPVDCVKLAFDKLADQNIDIVISGINDGGNLGTDVLYSGTVSAAIEGAVLNIPSIAVSLVHCEEDMDFEVAARQVHKFYKKFIYQENKPGTILNVNIPSCKEADIKGVIATCLGTIRYDNSFEEREDNEGNICYWLAGDIVNSDNGNTTDIYAVENNYISITPMHFELTRFDYIEEINTWFKEV